MQKKHSNQNTEKNVANPLQVSSKKPSLINIKNSIKRSKNRKWRWILQKSAADVKKKEVKGFEELKNTAHKPQTDR